MGLLGRRRAPEPAFPYTVIGHGRVLADTVKAKPRTRLAEVVGHEPREWGLLFVRDADRLPWTFYSPDPDYTALFAPTAHELRLTREVFTAKFPAWTKNWQIPAEPQW